MKLIPSMFCRTVLVAPVFFTTLSAVQAQRVDRSIGSHEVADVDFAPKRLIATLMPVDAGSEVKGGISFGLAGKGLEVSGHLDGLDPDKRYQLRVALPQKGLRGIDGGHPNATGNLGILSPNSSGGIDFRRVLKGVGLVKGELAVLGKALRLEEVPAEGAAGSPLLVASATVKAPESGRIPVQPSRLDELGPGERWF